MCRGGVTGVEGGLTIGMSENQSVDWTLRANKKELYLKTVLFFF